MNKDQQKKKVLKAFDALEEAMQDSYVIWKENGGIGMTGFFVHNSIAALKKNKEEWDLRF